MSGRRSTIYRSSKPSQDASPTVRRRSWAPYRRLCGGSASLERCVSQKLRDREDCATSTTSVTSEGRIDSILLTLMQRPDGEISDGGAKEHLANATAACSNLRGNGQALTTPCRCMPLQKADHLCCNVSTGEQQTRLLSQSAVWSMRARWCLRLKVSVNRKC